jgi:anti-sigma factor ChrR (cupin superfamily)
MGEIVHVASAEVEALEIHPGVRQRILGEGANGARAQLLEFDPGARFLKLDVHHPGPEEVYVVSGVFNDGLRDYPAGSFVHHPAGSSHLPQSHEGCVLVVYFPEG